jgi:GNAT superfamily N-acetyltransferase
MSEYPLSDLALSRRLERCEAKANAASVEARAHLVPELGATWIERAGAYAMFDGIDSPLTQTFALGIFQTPADEDLDAIEQFFSDRGAPLFHEVSPLVEMKTVELLSARGYRPIELTSVMYRPIALHGTDGTDGTDESHHAQVHARAATREEADVWANVATEGWSEYPAVVPLMQGLARVTATAAGSHIFLAEAAGRPIASGAVAIHDGIALLAGASTLPTARRQGAQRALLQARLRHAANLGCDLAMMCALPGSPSQRNAERQGFHIAYTRIKWGR